MDNNRTIPITIIIPSYNEEKNIEKVLTELLEELAPYKEIDCEILAYNDCSTDRTGAILENVAKKYKEIVPIHNHTNLGFGGTFQDGIQRSQKEKIMFLHGDGQFKASDVPPLIVESKDTDLLITYHSNYNDRLFIRRLYSLTFHTIVKTLFNVPYKYLNFWQIYNKTIFKEIDISSKKFTFMTEIVIKAQKLGYTIRERGVYLYNREGGKSTAIKLTSILDALYQMLKLWLTIYVFERKKYISRSQN